MLLYIDPATGHSNVVDGKPVSVILKTCERLHEELEGWLNYKHMGYKDPKYNQISMQEFQHALVAMDDLMTTIKPELTPEEDAELARFKSECMAR